MPHRPVRVVPAADQRASGGRGRVVAAFVVMIIVLGVLAYLLLPIPGITPSSSSTASTTGRASSTGASQHFDITVTATLDGATHNWEYTGLIPADVTFTARLGSSAISPLTYLWDFGDGTSATGAAVNHVFPVNCMYDIRLRVTSVTGVTYTGSVSAHIFSSQSMSKASVVCPRVGTAGVSRVVLEGGYTPANRLLQVSIDGTTATSTYSGNDGYWGADITRNLPAKPNGSTYAITISPVNISRTFVTVEGVTISPMSGVPGDAVTVQGRSYPPFTTISVYLGGAHMGEAQSDENGSFTANLTIPIASPLGHTGLYQISTSCQQLSGSCPVLGAQGTFVISSNTLLPIVSSPSTFPWVLLVAVAVVVALIYLYLRRRRGKVSQPVEQRPE